MEDSSTLGKRVHVITGLTPSKPRKKSRVGTPSSPNIRKPLFASDIAVSPRSTAKHAANRLVTKAKCHIVSPLRRSPVKRHRWTLNEERALVEFVSIGKTDPQYGLAKDTEWPSFRDGHCFWSDAALHIKTSTSANIVLTNNRVRGRVCTYLREKFKTLNSAEEHYNLTLSACLEDLNLNKKSTKVQVTNKYTQTTLHPSQHSSPAATVDADMQNIPVGLRNHILSCFPPLGISSFTMLIKKLIGYFESACLTEIVDFCFMELVKLANIDSNPADFISRSIRCMKLLQVLGKSNLLYKFDFCTTEKRPGTDKPLFLIDRMPFGLVEYQLEFFSATNIMQITVPHDFQVWYATLCAEFPTRFGRLFRGPMWSGVPKGQQKDPLTAKVNVAATSSRTVQKETAASDFTCEPGLQWVALKNLRDAHPKGRFWLKADACDVKAVLQQSTQGEWNGDSNLGDGKLELIRQEFLERVACLDMVSMGKTCDVLEQCIRSAADSLGNDITFLADGLVKADEVYQAKFNMPNTSQSMLMHLCWETVEFNTLLQQSQGLRSRLDNLLPYLDPTNPRVRDVVVYLKSMSQELKHYFRNLFVKKRQPAATHVLVIMVSEERRNKKPYALPVQYVPYHSIRDQYIRDLCKNLKVEMTKLGMKVVGMVTDGEFNSLRTQGETRPVHIWQLIHNARRSVSRQKERTLLQMLTKIREDANGDPVTEIHDEAIPKGVVQELHDLRVTNGWTMEDAITYLRGTLVPHGYTPYSFRANTPESYLDKLRSLVATYRFRHCVKQFKNDGVDFSLYLYVPEVDPTTGDTFHEREDHCHILKRIWKHTREGGPDYINVTAFDAAMMDPDRGLTHAALTGERKQSVVDAERMLSYLVSKFLREHEYAREADYVSTVAGWHEASDGRGLTELQRCQKNYAMLNMVLDEWMPWYHDCYDFATIDINRPVKGICGFSRESVIAVTTNVESIEYRRRQNLELGYEEHPRAGTTDDVEAVFALFHRFLGNIFTLKEFKACWRKVVREFCKRMDKDLPFYYWTANERYTEFEEVLPSFNERPEVDDEQAPVNHPLRLHRLTVNRREDSSVFTAGRSFLPARNQTTVRHRLHRPVVHLPPN